MDSRGLYFLACMNYACMAIHVHDLGGCGFSSLGISKGGAAESTG